jgi:glycosyltransferase involved in cell wall biosynthesis
MIDGKPTIMIGTPAYGGAMFMEYVDSLVRNIGFLESKGIKTRWQFMNKEALITRARNEIVRYFLDETRDDYLMFIDADIWFPTDGIYKLLEHNKSICCGVYPKKFFFWNRIRDAALRGEKDIEKFGCSYVLNAVDDRGDPDAVPLNDEGLVEVLHGGTGFMMIHRDVFKILRFKVPTYRTSLIQDNGQFLAPLTREFFGTSITELGLLLSEDYHFCELWKKEGGRIFADPTIELRHVGQHTFSGDLMRAGRNNT